MSSAQEFDPLKHKRGSHGRFTDMLRLLKPGSAAKLPDGIHVKAVNAKHGQGRRRKYQVIHANGKQVGGDHLEAGTAALVALNQSAQHEHPDAVGGRQRYENFAHAMGEGMGAAEAAGGGARAHMQQNAAEIRRAYPADTRAAIAKVTAEQRRGLLPGFQAEALLRHLRAEQAQQKRVNAGPKRQEAAAPSGAKRDVAGDPNKPKAGDLTPGVTKLTHSQHGEMIYMGRNATNHHVARKVADGEGGKKHIIRLKEIKLGHGAAEEKGGDKATESKGEPKGEDKAAAYRVPVVRARLNAIYQKPAPPVAKIKAAIGTASMEEVNQALAGSNLTDMQKAFVRQQVNLRDGTAPKPNEPSAPAKPTKVAANDPLMRSGSDMIDIKSVYRLPDGRVVRQEKEYEPVMGEGGRIRVGKRTFGTFWYSYANEAEARKGTRGDRTQYHTRADAFEHKRDRAKK
jgi:hypothetical protein